MFVPTSLRVALVAALALGLTACTAGDTPEPSATTSDQTTSSSAPVALPEDAAGRLATWVLEQLEPDAEADTAQIEERFAPSFLTEISAADLADVLAQLRDLGPWTVTSVQHGPGWLIARIEASDGELDLQLAHDEAELVTTLLFTPAPPPRESAGSWDALSTEVTGLPGSTSLFVARVVAGECEPVEGMPVGSAAGESLPIGSMFKLYVLGAVVDAVAAGDLAWDDEVTVTDELRSLPSGRLHEAPAGTRVKVREAAEAMIAISDNTATDLLIHAVGRDRVEAALTKLGHSDPASNIPFATTREFFQIGWGADESLRERWRGGDEAARRAILDELAGAELDVELERIGQVAVWPDGVDWFASGADLCAAYVALDELAGTPAGEPVREILAANPGIDAPEEYEYVGSKGGSATGTMAGSWYAETADGAVVVVLQTASQDRATHALTMLGIGEDALRLAVQDS